MTENSLVSELGTDIANVNIFHGLVGLQITNLDHEGVRTIVLACNIKLSHHHGVVGCATQRTNPPFGGSQCGGVDDESLVLGIPGGGRFEAANVRTVSQLGLSITSDDLVFLSTLKEELVLLGGSLLTESDLRG